ncbi:MAG: hypothetical protein WKF88_04205 [Ferruginibacter sp.]
MLKGLFINNRKAKDSIHESGYMVYQCLKLSDHYSLDYIEVDINNRDIRLGYDFYFFNYHDVTLSWLNTGPLKKDLGCAITMILEILPGDAFVRMPGKGFHIYCALDPTIRSKGKLYAFPRPLEKMDFEIPSAKNEIPVIGTFGFATKGKGFEHVVEAVNKEFDRAIVRINIPYGDFVPDSKEYSNYLTDLCKKTAKPGIDVQVTYDFMTKPGLVEWCAANDLNCFLYDRNFPGLAATTDQAIITGKPLSVSDNPTFRHITAYLPPYPHFSLRDSLERSVPIVKQINEDWSPEKFMKRFEEVLSANNITAKNKTIGETYQLPLFKPGVKNTFSLRVKKYNRKIKNLFK